MIQFLNKSFLIGIAAIALPVLIHFFARRKRKHIIFSSLIFLREMKTRQLKILKIREVLLLILRILALLFIVLSFSLPVITNKKLGSGSGSMLIMIDRSLSMNRNSVFEEAKAYAEKIISSYGFKGDISLYLFPDDQDRILTGTSDDLISLIKREKVLFAKPVIFKDLKRVRAYFEQKKVLNKELIIITDTQASTWMDENSSFITSDFNGRVYIVLVTGSVENTAVTKVMVKESVFSGKSKAENFITFRNFGKTYLKDIMARMLVDDRPLVQKLISIAPGEQVRIKFEIDNLTEGWHTGEIRLDQDDFDFDNRRFFSFYIPGRSRVFIVGKSKEDVIPIKLAIDPELDKQRSYVFYSGRSGWADSLDLCSVLIFSNYPAFSSEESEKIYDFLKAGNGVFYIPGDDVDLRNLVSCDFWPGSDWIIGGLEKTGKQQDRYFRIRDVDTGHPLFSGVFQNKTKVNVRSPAVLKRLKLNARSGLNIISFTDRLPFIAEHAIGRGKFLFCSTGVERNWSDFAFTALFPVLINKAVSYLSLDRFSEGENFYTGNYVKRVLEDVQIMSKYSMLDPKGERSLLMPEREGSERVFNIGRVWQNGSYTVLRDNTVFEVFSVNTDPAESDLSVLAPQKFKNIFPEASVRILNPNEDILKQIEKDRFGVPLWRYFLVAALIALLSEMFLSRVKREHK